MKKGKFARIAGVFLYLGSLGTTALLAQSTLSNLQVRGHSNDDWPVYGGQSASDHYSTLSQINRANVAKLHQVWKFDTGETGVLQTSPIVIGHVLYAYTPTQRVVALDAASGKLIWKFDAGIIGSAPARGLSYWSDGRESRLFAGVMNFLYALDPSTGRPIGQFGENGRIDLRKGLGGNFLLQNIALTSPGIVYKDLIIVGGREPETHPAPPGDIRAFDVHTGKLRWTFHTIPHPGEYGYDTWPQNAWKTAGAANNWSGMALDAKRGIVYVPTGSAVSDFYGADRVGNDLFADTLLAIDAETGRRIWHFQEVHHDLWDRDLPSPPALVTVVHQGERVDAVAQTTKQGYVYLFNRVTGQALFPIEERKYPASTVPGEVSSPTQPVPVLPRPFARQILTVNMLTKRTPAAHAWAVKRFKTLRSAGQFVPFSLNTQTIIFPGFDGGAEWGGPAIDLKTGVIYINSNEMAWTGGLVASQPTESPGEAMYRSQCAVCHGTDRTGSPPTFPSLVNIGRRMTALQIAYKVRQGGGRMPPFPNLNDAQLNDLVKYLANGDTTAHTVPPVMESAKNGIPLQSKSSSNGAVRNAITGEDTGKEGYQFTGYRKFVDPDGYPAVQPPWGTLNAIDLNTGKYLWKIPLGEYPALAARGMTHTGSENYGGPVVTAGHVLFIGATVYDNKFRAFDSQTGRLLWEEKLPSAGAATPATYMEDGKQYVVIAAGGSKEDKTPAEGNYVAFALP